MAADDPIAPRPPGPAGGPAAGRLGLWSGVGLVIANTVGVGVLTNTGYMAGRLGPRDVMLAWLVGGVMAMAGAWCYAVIAQAIPRSGGEYRYLSDLLHPFLGTLAGWTSLLVGFSAPVALAASTAGPFFATLAPGFPVAWVGTTLIALATAAQAFHLPLSKGSQDALALVKVVLLAGFIAAGLLLGSHAAPTWRPTEGTEGFALRPFAVCLIYVAFAFSGWNTAIYAAEEFHDPRRTVPRAMLLGTAIVTLVYLLVNWIFVANLSGASLGLWLKQDTSKITLAHLLMEQFAGGAAAQLASLLVVLSLASSVISLTMVGPRVSAAMAREGFLPGVLAAKKGRPPTGAVLLQGGLALALLATHSFEELLRSVGAVLTLTSGLTVAALVRMRFAPVPRPYPRPSLFSMACAVVYVCGSMWMLWFTLTETPRTLIWLGSVTALAAIAYFATAGRRRRGQAREGEGEGDGGAGDVTGDSDSPATAP